MMVGAGAMERDMGTTGTRVSVEGDPGPSPRLRGGINSQRRLWSSAVFPRFTLSLYLVKRQFFLTPWEPAPAPKHIYKTSAWAIFCVSSSSKDIQMTC